MRQVFLDTRSSWVGSWTAGQPVAVMYMGGGGDANSVKTHNAPRHGSLCVTRQPPGRCPRPTFAPSEQVWAYTAELEAGAWTQVTFTVTGGVLCGYLNGVRSGDCSDVDPGGTRG